MSALCVALRRRYDVRKCWCRLGDSNTRPTHYECVALPAELRRLSESGRKIRKARPNCNKQILADFAHFRPRERVGPRLQPPSCA